jgi:hypothetical protein
MKPRPIPATACLDTYKGRRYFKFTVVAVTSGLFWSKKRVFSPVIAESAASAIEVVREEIYREVAKTPDKLQPTEFLTWGVKGGLTHRFSGWESMVGGAIMHRVTPAGKQRDWVEELA